MGYTTQFKGHFNLDKPLAPEHFYTLKDLGEHRHEGNAPSYYCQWTPTRNGAGIQWDGGEKFYAYAEWLQLICDKYLTPWGYLLNGKVLWQGEEIGDVGHLVVENNKVTANKWTGD